MSVAERTLVTLSLTVFDEALRGADHPTVPKMGEQGYSELVALLLAAISEGDSTILANEYPSISPDQWNDICDIARRVYFQAYSHAGSLTLANITGLRVLVYWDTEPDSDPLDDVEAVLREALTKGVAVKDIIAMALRIEETLWHGQ